MRVILASLAAAIAILTVSVSAQTASAQPGNPTRPYCLRDGINGAGMWDCSYYSMQQCLATQHGNGGSCQPNPWYTGPVRR
jgi:Protein of unknown function (DUF3551)